VNVANVKKVNPQAVCQDGMDVFTANRRSVLYMTHKETGKPMAFVAIGALLVGSIVWTAGGQKKKQISRGEELGYVLIIRLSEPPT
jgi:phosphatidylserine decarboxylase